MENIDLIENIVTEIRSLMDEFNRRLARVEERISEVEELLKTCREIGMLRSEMCNWSPRQRVEKDQVKVIWEEIG